MAESTKPTIRQINDKGLAHIVDEVVADAVITDEVVTDKVTADTLDVVDGLDDPGDKAGAADNFDKVLKITVGGVDYWIGLYSDNTTT